MDWYFKTDHKKCVGCGACVYACQFFGEDILYMGEACPFPVDNEIVYLCRDCKGHCFDFCPNDAIEIGKC